MRERCAGLTASAQFPACTPDAVWHAPCCISSLHQVLGRLLKRPTRWTLLRMLVRAVTDFMRRAMWLAFSSTKTSMKPLVKKPH